MYDFHVRTMDVETLIELVKQYDFLYNQDNKYYTDIYKKDIAWMEIGKVMKQPGKECKRQWSCIRDTYRRVLKKKRDEARSGIPLKRVKKWKLDDEMSFLNPFIRERDSSNVSILEGIDDYVNEEKVHISLNKERNTFDESVSQINESPSASYRKLKSSRDFANKDLNSIHKTIKPETTASMFTNYPYDEKGEKTLEDDTGAADDTVIDLFFASIASTVRKFNKYNKAVAKARVFSIISELEISEVSHKFEYEG